jgi:hypothetical protein
MKLFPIVSLILVSVVLTASNCRKKNTEKPIDKLPPETQTGANTFGCLIDGNAFIPKGNPLGGAIKKAQYQFVNGKQSFGVSGSRIDGEKAHLVGIIGDSIRISIGTFNLASLAAGKFRGGYTYRDITNPSGISYLTDEFQRGELIIKHFDTINQIVSGTFWFDAINSRGQIVQVREGRFDLPYVR